MSTDTTEAKIDSDAMVTVLFGVFVQAIKALGAEQDEVERATLRLLAAGCVANITSHKAPSQLEETSRIQAAIREEINTVAWRLAARAILKPDQKG